jgi:hypothetical protein
MRGTLAVALLTPILLLSIVAQVSLPAREWFSQKAIFRLIPSWRFFGPTPATSDVHLLVRQRETNLVLGEWFEIPIPGGHVGRALWNPGRFPDKALHDLTQSLVRCCHELRERADDDATYGRARQVLQPYLALLAWVLEATSDLASDSQRQFALVSAPSTGDDAEPQVLFVSSFHAVR